MDQNGCIGISNSVSYIIESIEDNNGILSIYPNPTTNWITIENKRKYKQRSKYCKYIW